MYYHKEHFWAKIEGDVVDHGNNRFCPKTGRPGRLFMSLPSPWKDGGTRPNPVDQWNSENGGRIYAPVSGKIESINGELKIHLEFALTKVL